MKNILIGILIGLLFCAGLYYFIRQGNPVPRVVSFVVTLPPDTVQKPAEVKYIKLISKDSAKYWRARYDSLHKIISLNDTTGESDSALAEYVLPEIAIVDDTLSTSYVTIFPMNPFGTRMRVDSTLYKPFTCDTTILLPAQKKGLYTSTIASVGIGSGAGAAIASIPGAMIGGIAGLVFDWWFVP
jgi:hypothetical protein